MLFVFLHSWFTGLYKTFCYESFCIIWVSNQQVCVKVFLWMRTMMTMKSPCSCRQAVILLKLWRGNYMISGSTCRDISKTKISCSMYCVCTYWMYCDSSGWCRDLLLLFFFCERSVSLYKQDMAQASKSDEKLAPDNRQWCRYWRKRARYTRIKRGIYLMHLISFCIPVSIMTVRRRVKWEQPSQCALLVASVRMTWFRQIMVVHFF